MLFGFAAPPGDREMGRIDQATYAADLDRQLRFAEGVFDSIWVSDHLMEGDRYRIEPWTQLTWIAARTTGVGLGNNVLANSYRHPALLAKMAASLQASVGGPVHPGVRGGLARGRISGVWLRVSVDARADRADGRGAATDQGAVGAGPVTFEGEFYQLREAYCEPRPDPVPPILIGGSGKRYLLRAVAEHADWWLSYADRPELLTEQIAALADHCRDVGRDPATIRRAMPLTVYLDRDVAAARRWAGDFATGERAAFAGDPAALRDRLREVEGLGFDMVQLRFAGLMGTADLELFADEVLPAFR